MRNAASSQFTIAQLLGLTALAGVVFWLVRTTGLPVTLLLLGVAANLAIGWLRQLETMTAGAVWGGAIHLLAMQLALLTDVGEGARLATTAYTLLGAWIGALAALCRGAADLASVDRPAPSAAAPRDDSCESGP